jgi:hypothetical protein
MASLGTTPPLTFADAIDWDPVICFSRGDDQVKFPELPILHQVVALHAKLTLGKVSLAKEIPTFRGAGLGSVLVIASAY